MLTLHKATKYRPSNQISFKFTTIYSIFITYLLINHTIIMKNFERHICLYIILRSTGIIAVIRKTMIF